jgi:hypothetical protein
MKCSDYPGLKEIAHSSPPFLFSDHLLVFYSMDIFWAGYIGSRMYFLLKNLDFWTFPEIPLFSAFGGLFEFREFHPFKLTSFDSDENHIFFA